MPHARLCALAASLLPLAGADLSVLAIGDWGGGSDEEPSTESQRLTAMGMLRKAQEHSPNFTLLMGDNFYEHGIHECAEKSGRFQSTFEDVYASLLPDQPFFAMGGNHDYGEGRLANISAQLEYSRSSQQWRYPSLWYKIRREFSAANETRVLEVLVLDTVVLCGNGYWNEAFIDAQIREVGHTANRREERPGDLRRAVAEEQWAWMEAELRASTADFLWVTGHYPIWSGGNDGSTQCLIDRLRPLLTEHGAHYISGHDHMLEHFKYNDLNAFVVGAGKECCYPPVNLGQTPPGALRYMLAGHNGQLSRPRVPFPVRGGFASLHFGAEFVSVELHSDNGTVLYKAAPIARRGGRAAATSAGSRVVVSPSSVEAGWAMPLLLVALFGWALLPRLQSRWAGRPPAAAEPLLA
mmetsp:Transcript_96468/g.287910  ORF Transcript_96468/g.287910 Transcript_96468/m.287910 type:complete len:410 (-) Transcript_96468:15-1244(-)